jgi:hypothetical protein
LKIAVTCSETIPEVLFPFDSTQNSFQKSEPANSTATIPQSGTDACIENYLRTSGKAGLCLTGVKAARGNKKGWCTKAKLPILSVRNRAIDCRNHLLTLILLQLNLKIQTHSSGSSTLELPAQPSFLHHVTSILIRQVFSGNCHFRFGAYFKRPLMQGLISFTGKVTVMIYREEFRKRNKNARQELLHSSDNLPHERFV